MQVAATKMVKINYTLKDKDGVVIDSTDGGEPLEVMHGVGRMIPGFEREISGLEVGEKKSLWRKFPATGSTRRCPSRSARCSRQAPRLSA